MITDPGPVGSPATVNVLLQDAKSPGEFLSPVSYSLGDDSVPESIVVADVNGDGHPDIVIGTATEVSVLLQNTRSPGTFLAAVNYQAQGVTQLAVADVNGDGLVDIVVPVGVSHPVVNGVVTNNPGVLLQNAGSRGTFGTLQDLP